MNYKIYFKNGQTYQFLDNNYFNYKNYFNYGSTIEYLSEYPATVYSNCILTYTIIGL
jgi:hypothetical protein